MWAGGRPPVVDVGLGSRVVHQPLFPFFGSYREASRGQFHSPETLEGIMLRNQRNFKGRTLVLACLLLFSLAAYGQQSRQGSEQQTIATVTFLDSTKEQDGLVGSIRRVQTESAKLVMKSGRLIEGPKELLEITTYDRNGKRIANQSYVQPNYPAGKQEYKYDDKGNVIELTLHGDDGSIQGRESYSYEFDRIGNWTKMVTSLVLFEDGKLKYEPVEVTYRKITYYFDQTVANIVQSVAAPAADAAQPTIVRLGKEVTPVPAEETNIEKTGGASATRERLTSLKTENILSTSAEINESQNSANAPNDRSSKLISASSPDEPAKGPVTPSKSTETNTPNLKPERASGSESAASAKTDSSTKLTSPVSPEGSATSPTTPTKNAESNTPGLKPSGASGSESAASAKTDAQVAREYYTTARQLLSSGDFKGSLAAYQHALQLEPRSAQLCLELGYVYLKLNKHGEAAKAFAQATHLQPNLAEAHYGLGLEYFTMNRYADSVGAFKEAVRLSPEMAKAHYGLALAYQELRKGDLLMQEYRILQRLDAGLAKQVAKTFNGSSIPCNPGRSCK